MLPLQAKLDEAISLHQTGRLAEAKAIYEEILKIEPQHVDALHLLGATALEAEDHLLAIELIGKAIAINPNEAAFYSNYGLALQKLSRRAEAIASYDRAIAINSHLAQAHFNRGSALYELGQFTEALASYDRAIAIDPDFADAYWDKALILLLTGDFQNGWDLCEWRLRIKKIKFHTHSLINKWDGKKLSGSLLVLSEQGIGDKIFYAGMINDLSDLVNNITICIDEKLIPLYKRSFNKITFISNISSLTMATFDAQIYMPDLGRYFRYTQDEFKNVKVPYLKASPEKSKLIRNQLGSNRNLVCGLSWLSTNPKFGLEKSLSLEHLQSILTLPNIDFVDLQYGDTQAEQAAVFDQTGVQLKRIPTIDNFADIDDLAALINACDVVLTISNTTAHLAGALGKPVMVMLPYSTGLLWYWHENRNDSPWYPTAQLFRQAKAGDWATVLMKVKQTLEANIKAHQLRQ